MEDNTAHGRHRRNNRVQGYEEDLTQKEDLLCHLAIISNIIV